MYSVRYFNDENGEFFLTVSEEGTEETVRIKPLCCKKYLEPDKGLCTGCPELGEEERILRLRQRIKKKTDKG